MIANHPLFALERDGFEEVLVAGEIVVFDGRGIVYRAGSSAGEYPVRSVLKPFQFIACGMLSGESVIGPRHVPALGSISATRAQVDQLETWYRDDVWDPYMSRLRLPPSWPMDAGHRAHLESVGARPNVRFHPCFSKHMAIVEGCAAQGWDVASYTSREHPFHGRLVQCLREHLGDAAASVPFVTDGCQLPSPVLSLLDMSRLYWSLACSESLVRVCAAMMGAPDWVGGPGRLDTMLMLSNPGRVVAKEGADGLMAVGVVPGSVCPNGLGIVVKLSGGYAPAFAALALAPLLERLEVVSPHVVPSGQKVRYYGGVLNMFGPSAMNFPTNMS